MIPPHAGRDRLPAHNEAILRNFNPPAPCGAGPLIPRPVLDTVTFQSTRPLRGGTGCLGKDVGRRKISIHPPLAGRDPKRSVIVIVFVISIHPPRAVIDDARNISIHPPLAGRDPAADRVADRRALISIHPPLAGRDARNAARCPRTVISIHPPLAGRDRSPATGPPWRSISIHPPLAGRDQSAENADCAANISIHPPLAGRDRAPPSVWPSAGNFNPPAPCGAGRDGLRSAGSPVYFNPPAPCGAGLRAQTRRKRAQHFNPPAPCGAGPILSSIESNTFVFQSTRPLRGGTAILHKKTVQNIAYCTKSAFTLAVLSGFLALMRPFFCQTCTNFGANLPKNRCSLPVRTLIPSGPPPADSRH